MRIRSSKGRSWDENALFVAGGGSMRYGDVDISMEIRETKGGMR